MGESSYDWWGARRTHCAASALIVCHFEIFPTSGRSRASRVEENPQTNLCVACRWLYSTCVEYVHCIIELFMYSGYVNYTYVLLLIFYVCMYVYGVYVCFDIWLFMQDSMCGMKQTHSNSHPLSWVCKDIVKLWDSFEKISANRQTEYK